MECNGLLSNERANEIIWQHFTATMMQENRNPLASAYHAYDWYLSSMPRDPQLDLWAEKVKKHDITQQALIEAEHNKSVERIQTFLIEVASQNDRERETIQIEISQLLSGKEGVDIIHRHFKQTMIEKGKNPLSVHYDQTHWYTCH